MGRFLSVLAVACLLAFALPSSPAQAQSTTQPSGLDPVGGPFPPDYIQLARTNAKSGAVADRRPGSWTSAGLSRTSNRQNEIVNQYGGVTYDETATEDDGVRTQVLVSVLQTAFDVLNELITQVGISWFLNGGTTDQIPSVPVS